MIFLQHVAIKDVASRVEFAEQTVRAYRPDELKSLSRRRTRKREIPLPDFLLAALKNAHFPTKDNKANGPMLQLLKSLAKRAGQSRVQAPQVPQDLCNAEGIATV